MSEEDLVIHAGHPAFELYKKNLGDTVLDINVTSETYDAEIEEYRTATYGCPPECVCNIAYLDYVATMSKNRKTLFVATVNVSEKKSEPCRIRIRNTSVKPEMKVCELNGADIEAGVDTGGGIVEKKDKRDRRRFFLLLSRSFCNHYGVSHQFLADNAASRHRSE